jgi:hypothetical protein
MSSELGAFILLTPKRFPFTPSLSPSGGEGQGEGKNVRRLNAFVLKTLFFDQGGRSF